MRLEGASWRQVGEALGVSKQAAMKRWRYLNQQQVRICVRESADGTRSAWFQAGALVWGREGLGGLEAASVSVRALVTRDEDGRRGHVIDGEVEP
jgi:hypothetical protein